MFAVVITGRARTHETRLFSVSRIVEKRHHLDKCRQIERQTEITEEVMDVISGFEAMTGDEESGRAGR